MPIYLAIASFLNVIIFTAIANRVYWWSVASEGFLLEGTKIKNSKQQ